MPPDFNTKIFQQQNAIKNIENLLNLKNNKNSLKNEDCKMDVEKNKMDNEKYAFHISNKYRVSLC